MYLIFFKLNVISSKHLYDGIGFFVDFQKSFIIYGGRKRFISTEDSRREGLAIVSRNNYFGTLVLVMVKVTPGL